MGTIRCSDEVQLDVNSLLHIFSLLDTKDKKIVAQVCRYWKDLVYCPCLWKKVCAVLYQEFDDSLVRSLHQRRITHFVCRGTKEEDLALLFATVPDITRLDIDECRHVSQQFLKENLSTLNKLEFLHVTQCSQVDLESLYQESSLTNVLSRLKSTTFQDFNISRSSCQAVIMKLPSLEAIKKEDMYRPHCDQNLSAGCINGIIESCPNFRRLDLGWFSKESWKTALERLDLKAITLGELYSNSDEGYISAIGDFLPHLESLNISYHNAGLTDEVIYTLKKLKNLKHFVYCVPDFFSWDEQDESYQRKQKQLFQEISKFDQLETLTIQGSVGDDPMINTDATLYSLVENLPNLRSLEIEFVGNISAEYADLIGDCLPKLRSLKLIVVANANSSGIGFLCGRLSNLTNIHIWYNGLLNEDMKEIASGLFPNKLKSLNVSGSRIKDQGLTYIANGLKMLTSLDISSCSVSDAGVSVIAEHLYHLQSLSVTGRKVTNHGAIMIGKHLKGLEQLKIHGTKVGDQGFAFICNHLPKLHTLQAFCDLVTDQGFLEGVAGLGRLRTLQIGSHRIHMEAIEASLNHLKSLMHLTVRSISVSHACVQIMVNKLSCLSKFVIIRCNHCPKIMYRQISNLCETNGIKLEAYHQHCRLNKQRLWF